MQWLSYWRALSPWSCRFDPMAAVLGIMLDKERWDRHFSLSSEIYIGNAPYSVIRHQCCFILASESGVD